MIVTLTPNPSVDRTIQLSGPLERGEVQRSATSHDEAGGKGVNVAEVVANAGHPAVAVLPGDHDDPLLGRLRELQLTHRAVPTGLPSRINLTLAEPDGTTTKVNAPGPRLGAEHLDRLVREVQREAVGARWAVLSGSLPPGVPLDWYGTVAAALRRDGLQVAVDTSGAPLEAALDRAADAIDLIKPNTEELADLLGHDPDDLEDDPALAVKAAREVIGRGVHTILLTMGSRGAMLIRADDVWTCPAPVVQARSTVGAGDSSLAGYLVGALEERSPAESLALAVSYGAAAASLPGSTMPGPADLPPLTTATAL